MSTIEPDRLAGTCAATLDENRADNIVMLNVRPLTSIGEYFLIATARNSRHLRALSRQVEDVVEETFDKAPLGIEGLPESGWILVDLGDVIVHLFDSDRRDLYALEMLWGDAERVDWHNLDGVTYREPNDHSTETT